MLNIIEFFIWFEKAHDIIVCSWSQSSDLIDNHKTQVSNIKDGITYSIFVCVTLFGLFFTWFVYNFFLFIIFSFD